MEANGSTSGIFQEDTCIFDDGEELEHSSNPCDDPHDDFSEEEDVENDNSLNCEPYLNMEFASTDEAYKFYNLYACKKGFSIRKAGGSYKSVKLGKITTFRLCCSKGGFSESQKQEKKEDEFLKPQRTPEKIKAHKRSGCKASFYIKLKEDGKWFLNTFNDEHNHDLIVSPSKKRYFLSHRFITDEQKEIIHKLSGQNMKVDQIMAIIAESAGGIDKVWCTKRDILNEIAASNRNLRGVEVRSMICTHLDANPTVQKLISSRPW